MSTLMTRSALELAALVRAGEVTARELVEESLARIERLDPEIGAFTHVAREEALAAADAIAPGDARPFAGVPLAIKDNRAVAGLPMGMGSAIFAGVRPPFDAFVVRRLRESGFVIVGTTKLPELGILPTTEPRAGGTARNPWDLGRTPGGSSGGAAAAVAAGMVPVAHGNDGGGSIRIPAACCGLVGLKPSRGRVSVGPVSGQSFLVCDGVLTRTVAETAAVLDRIAGPFPGDAAWAPPPGEPFALTAAAPPAPGLRIGLALNPALDGAELDPVCRQAAHDAAALLESLGHSVEEVEPPWSGRDLLSDFTRAFGPLIAAGAAAGAALTGREPSPETLEPLSLAIYEHARSTDTLAYLAAQDRLERIAREVVVALDGYDAVLTPALARRPVPIGEIHGQGEDPWALYARSGHFTPYTAIVNVTGQPAIALPLFHGEDGLPLAVQLIGRPAGEGPLLALAAQLEAARPWADRLAPPALRPIG